MGFNGIGAEDLGYVVVGFTSWVYTGLLSLDSLRPSGLPMPNASSCNKNSTKYAESIELQGVQGVGLRAQGFKTPIFVEADFLVQLTQILILMPHVRQCKHVTCPRVLVVYLWIVLVMRNYQKPWG